MTWCCRAVYRVWELGCRRSLSWICHTEWVCLSYFGFAGADHSIDKLLMHRSTVIYFNSIQSGRCVSRESPPPSATCFLALKTIIAKV